MVEYIKFKKYISNFYSGYSKLFITYIKDKYNLFTIYIIDH